MTTMATNVPALLTVEQAIAIAGHPGRNAAYEQLRTEGHLLGVRPIRVGRKIFIPRAALDRVLAGVVVEDESNEDLREA